MRQATSASSTTRQKTHNLLPATSFTTLSYPRTIASRKTNVLETCKHLYTLEAFVHSCTFLQYDCIDIARHQGLVFGQTHSCTTFWHWLHIPDVTAVRHTITTYYSVLQVGCIPINYVCITDVNAINVFNPVATPQQEVQISHVFFVMQVFKESALMAQTNFGNHIATNFRPRTRRWIKHQLEQEPYFAELPAAKLNSRTNLLLWVRDHS